MKVITAANHKMRRFARACVQSAEKLGYSTICYDLGGLGFGKPFALSHGDFHKKGYYHEIRPGFRSLGMHKLAIINDALHAHNEFTIYVDADTLILRKLDDIGDDFNVGLTVRPAWEVAELFQKRSEGDDYFIYEGFVNAGVMFFNATKGARRFLAKWHEATVEMNDDQGAINKMLSRHFPLQGNTLLRMDGIRIRTFDAIACNYAYFDHYDGSKRNCYTDEGLKISWKNAKILHFKGKMREKFSQIYALYTRGFLKSKGRSKKNARRKPKA